MARRHNLGTVVEFEVTRTLKRRRFWVGTLLVPVAIGAVLGLNIVSNSSTTQKAEAQKNEKFDFAYIDRSGYVEDEVARAVGGTPVTNSEEAISDVKSGKLTAFFYFPSNPETQRILVYGEDNGVFDNGKYSAVAGALLTTSAQSKIVDKKLLTILANNLKIHTQTFSAGRESGSIGDAIPPLLFLLIFYLVILLLGNQMLTSTQEEKENRVTEMILTTLNPTTLVVGKIIALFIIGIVQMAIFILPTLVSYIFFRNELRIPNFDLAALNFSLIPMVIGLLILISGFVLFTGTLVAVGAIMPTAKEAGQIYGVVVTLLFVPFWVISLVASDPQALIVQVFTYFPYSAPVTAMVRNGLGSLPTWQAGIVISELFIFGYVVLRMAIRLFALGSMEYSKKVSLRRLLPRK
ncbi:MAG: ABC transporter permease [Actinobacteria bacterium]|nr:ABC transporter permease [Actinomycetota bacterium]